MRHYELVTILSPMLNQDQATEAWGRIKDFIANRDGEIVREQSWGTRRLAYPIRKGSYNFLEGSYYLTLFSTEKSFNRELETFLRLDDRILRSLVIATGPPPPAPPPAPPQPAAAPAAQAQSVAEAPVAEEEAPASEAPPAAVEAAGVEAEEAPTAEVQTETAPTAEDTGAEEAGVEETTAETSAEESPTDQEEAPSDEGRPQA